MPYPNLHLAATSYYSRSVALDQSDPQLLTVFHLLAVFHFLHSLCSQFATKLEFVYT